MRKFIAFLLTLMFLMTNGVSYSQEITPESERIAANAPLSKLAGTWWNDNIKIVIKSNGAATAYYPYATGSEIYDFSHKFTLKKNGDELYVTGFENGFTAKPKSRYRSKNTEQMMYLSSLTQLNQLEGTILYLDNNYFAVESQFGSRKYINWYEKDAHVKKRLAEEERERKEEERQRALKEEQERILKENWSDACDTNTLEGYETFLQKYPESEFTQEAKTKITLIKSNQEWNELKNSDNIQALQQFVDTYPEFSEIDFVKSRLYSLQALQAYNNGDIENAISKFNLVSDKNAIPAQAQTAYQDYKQTVGYRALSSNSSPDTLEKYLEAYPSSPYTTEVRNYLALSLANNFTTESTDADYKNALSYASGTTTSTIQNKIDENIQLQKEKAKQDKRERRRLNGGYCGILLDWGTFTWNGRVADGLFQYNFGIKFKVGNFNDRVQFALGIKPGVGAWDFEGIYKEGDQKKKNGVAFFEMPVEAELRLNLAKVSKGAWFYLDGRYFYNAIGNKRVLTPMGFSAGLGFANNTMDLTLYYSRQLGSIKDKYHTLNGLPNPFLESKNLNNFGLSFGFYIRL